MEKFQVAVIGAGPGGYQAAIRCAQLGMSTVCIDHWYMDGKPALGGTCLNVGCIPSKALLDSSEHYSRTLNELSDHGISVEKVRIDIEKMQQRKSQVVSQLTGGIETLFLKNKIAWKQAHGKLLNEHQVQLVFKSGESEVIEAQWIIIATGSNPAAHANIKFDDERVVDSSGALAFDRVPESLAVVGGGVIGLELGSVWKRLGSNVTVFNRGDHFLSKSDVDISKQVFGILQNQGLDIKLGAVIDSVSIGQKDINISYHDRSGQHTHSAEKILVAIGRTPNTEGLNLEAVSVARDDKNYIKVDASCRTSVANIFAIGDCTPGPMLAHRASEEGIAVAERIAGQKPTVNHLTIPYVIYTWPEVAWVGKTEQQLIDEKMPFVTGKFPFLANGRAKAMGVTEGLVKILADRERDTILGVHILGANASELISEAVVAMEFGASAEDLARIVHAHPTLSESIHEAAMAVDRRAIHI